MIFHARQLAVLLGPVFLLGACGPSGQQHATQLLNNRLQTRLAPDIAAGRAVLQPQSDGATVTLLDPTLFPNSADVLDNRENDVRASVVEALLDPSLMRLRVTDTSSLPDRQRDTRVLNVMQYFTSNGLGLTLEPAEPLQAAPPAPAQGGLTVTIKVQCPNRDDRAGYGSGRSKPICD